MTTRRCSWENLSRTRVQTLPSHQHRRYLPPALAERDWMLSSNNSLLRDLWLMCACPLVLSRCLREWHSWKTRRLFWHIKSENSPDIAWRIPKSRMLMKFGGGEPKLCRAGKAKWVHQKKKHTGCYVSFCRFSFQCFAACFRWLQQNSPTQRAERGRALLPEWHQLDARTELTHQGD